MGIDLYSYPEVEKGAVLVPLMSLMGTAEQLEKFITFCERERGVRISVEDGKASGVGVAGALVGTPFKVEAYDSHQIRVHCDLFEFFLLPSPCSTLRIPALTRGCLRARRLRTWVRMRAGP